MTVSRQQFEASLDKVRAHARDPREGVYGPSSMMWRINRERLLFLSGARAVLLQEAHPFVAHGIDQHSSALEDPIGRFVRTFKHVHGMVFGDLETAMASARRVHKYHTSIRGQIGETTGRYSQGAPYEANDEQALFWVHATVWESSIMTYELIFRPLSAAEKEQYYQETKLFAYMFGIPDEVIPPTWPDFLAYNQRMWNSNDLAVGTTARAMADFVLTPRLHSQEPVLAFTRPLTAGMLPPRMRQEYGLAFGPRERAVYRAAVLAIRASWRLLPRSQRFVPAYLDARSRLGTAIVPTLPERLVSRAYPARMQRGTAA